MSTAGRTGSRKRLHVPSSSDEEDEQDSRADARKKSRPTASGSPEDNKRAAAMALLSVSGADMAIGDSDLDDLNSHPDAETELDDRNSHPDASSNMGDRETDENGIDHGDGDEDVVEGDGHGRNKQGRVMYKPEYERGNDGYVAGSVTRIKMTNFMTYDHVEFNPGPHLNMILGPNGTGKSSIAAAIAIGLGFPPKVMGRANELKAYVKQGADEAIVEIELKGRKGKRNTVIWRRFNREDEKSDWKLDGETTTRREVVERVLKSGIQANNLCSFLPQDKVAEFAKMAPVTVLKETMRAAGDPRLTSWHQTLVDSGAKQKEIQAHLETHVSTRDRLQTQVDSLAPDVAHVQEREAREKEAEVLGYLVGVVEHEELKKLSAAARKEFDAVTRQADKIKAKRKPLIELDEHWEKKTQKAEVKIRATEGKYNEGMKELRKRHTHAEDVASKSRNVDDQLGQLKRRHERREEEKRVLRERIETARAIMDEPREEVDAAIKAKQKTKTELFKKVRQIGTEIEEVEEEWNDSRKALEELNKELAQLTAKQANLENIEVQKETAARDLDPSIAYALDWLAEKGHTLEATVHKPPMISVSVQRKEFAWQVEACTSVSQRKTFVCTTQADMDRLLALNGTPFPSRMRDGRRLEGTVQLNIALVAVDDSTVNPQRPCRPEKLQQLGCDGFAIDFIDADPAIIAFLSSRANMHMTALSQKPMTHLDNNALSANGIRTWVACDGITRSTQSNYGNRDFVFSTNIGKQDARAFNLSVDREAVKRIVDSIATKKQQKLDREAPHSEIKSKLDELNRKREGVKREAHGIESDIKEMSEKVRRYQKAMTDIESFNIKLKRIEAEPTQEEARRKLKAEKLKFAQARIKPLESWQAAGDTVVTLCSEYITQTLTLVQSSVNHDAISSRLNEGNEETRQILEAVEAAKIKRDDAKNRVTQKWEMVKRQMGQAPREIRQEVGTRASASDLPSLDDLESQLQTLRAQLELAVNIPGNVVDRYNNLMKQLEAAQRTVDEEETDLAKIKRELKRTLDKFDPALEELAHAVSAKFSAAFARVRCTGEVRVRRVEGDFSAWGIEILVSYRDGDSMAILTGSHQSGGERSLATVTYLMSLSEMSRTPFSLVDEINQGMDQRAERAVHNQLVEVTCDADAGQYFLITPKLLTGLTYHPKMKVLIINNGTHLPDSRDKTQRYGGLSACIKRFAKAHSIPA